MKNCMVLWRRELSAMFLSPVAYATLAVFIASAAGTFLVAVFHNTGSQTPPQVFLFESLILWLTLLIPVVTMRLFAEERKSGTIETLMTAPVTDLEVVISKYAGALTFVLLAAAAVIGSLFFLDFMSSGLTGVDVGSVKSGSIFIALFCFLAIAVGEWISLQTSNQIVAGLASMCALWGVLLGGWFLQALPLGLDRIGESISVAAQLEVFERGFIDSRTIVLFVSATAFSLFACVRALEQRRGQ
jgi:ABC-2 type transport system permease protein